jgi:general secretion pathway protein L
MMAHIMMASEYLGLDIGRTAIKAVRFRRTFNGRESAAYFHQPIAPADSCADESEPSEHGAGYTPATAKLLKHFITRHGLGRTPIISTLSCRHVFFRPLALPFQPRAKLLKIVPFEVEQSIPMPLENVFVDYQVLSPRPEGRHTGMSDLLVAAVPKAHVQTHLTWCAEAGFDPASIGVDALALLSYFDYHQEQMRLPGHVAIVDLGASKTTLCLMQGGRPVIVRTLLWGSDEITEAMATRYACAWADAEKKKHEISAPHIAPCFETLVKELRISLHAYEAATKVRPQHLILCGGGSLLRGLPQYVAGQLRMEPLVLPASGSVHCPTLFSVAFGLAVRAAGSRPAWTLSGRRRAVAASRIDFKRLCEIPQSRREHARKELWLAGLALLLLALLALADFTARLWLKEDRVRDLRASLHATFQQAFPGIPEGFDEVDRATVALDSVKKQLSRLGADQPHMIQILAHLVRYTPPYLLHKATMLTIEPDAIVLEGETGGFDAVERIKQGLGAVPGVSDAAVSDARVGATPNQVLFRITLTLKKR